MGEVVDKAKEAQQMAADAIKELARLCGAQHDLFFRNRPPGDARDAIVFNSRTGTAATARTAHNLEVQAALGVTS